MQVSATEWAVLNATADDVEDLEQIYRSVHHESPTAPRLPDVADAVRSLVEKGFLAPRMGENGGPPAADDLSFIWKARFEVTPRGRAAWESSAPVVDEPRPERPSLFGVWKDIAVDIPFEVFKENRREMVRSDPPSTGNLTGLALAHPPTPLAPVSPTTRSGEADAGRPGQSPRRRSLYGLWKEYNIDLSAEDLAKVRREMWRNFPRDIPAP